MSFDRSAGTAISRFARLCCLLAMTSPLGAAAESVLDLPPPEADYEAWLITVSPGEIYWQRFGHNAIWLREPALELNHSFNFGYFDFEQRHFLRRFIMGRMLYQSLAFPAPREFAGYAAEGRSIRAQRLNLKPGQYRRLREHLLWHVQPEHRDYLYDYYRDNCSTRIRDALDLALSGTLSAHFAAQAAELGYRGHTRRLTAMTFWYYLGLELGLGRPVDRPISRWEEMFIPAVVAEAVAERRNPATGLPLVRQDRWIYRGELAAPPASPPVVWPRYLSFSGMLLVLGWLVCRRRPRWPLRLGRGWIGLSAVLGLGLLSLWAFTDHWVAGPNYNLLLFNPLFLPLMHRRMRKPLAWLVVLGALLATAQAIWPAGQYTRDVVATVVPLQLAAACCLLRFSESTAGSDAERR